MVQRNFNLSIGPWIHDTDDAMLCMLCVYYTNLFAEVKFGVVDKFRMTRLSVVIFATEDTFKTDSL